MASGFLLDRSARRWTADRAGVDCERYGGDGPLAVLATEHGDRPAQRLPEQLCCEWREEHVGPVLAVAIAGETAHIGGPGGAQRECRSLDIGEARRLSDRALARPNRQAARRFLTDAFDQLDDGRLGVRTRGLLAPHVLTTTVREREDWPRAVDDGRAVLDSDGRELLDRLGHGVDPIADRRDVLEAGSEGSEFAVAVDLQAESFAGLPAAATGRDCEQDVTVARDPVARALADADRRDLEYVVACAGRRLRLYATDPGAGLGPGGRTTSFVELDLELLSPADAGYLPLLFGPGALCEGGTVEDLLAASTDHAADLRGRLRKRIYDHVVPELAAAIADRRDLEEPSREQLDETYRMALVELYRLLFVAFAEAHGLLPRRRPAEWPRSLTRTARDLLDRRRSGEDFAEDSTALWDEVSALESAVRDGRRARDFPAHGSRLFAADPGRSEAEAALAELDLADDRFGPVLAALLVDEPPAGEEAVLDFRNLGVRTLGTLYEGLLESELSVADRSLTVSEDGRYVPADSAGEEPVVAAGEVYLHGTSGERKASGTYYTKSRFVEHLLDCALKPALDEHLDRLDALDEEAAAEAFFDFRAADVAMGSGHFLLAAVDRIERRLHSYLADRPLPGVAAELDRLDAAVGGGDSGECPVGRGRLLRRQVARRCIYGVDADDFSTELARLSLWLATFVPGRPLSALDYGLATGDSLAGVGTLAEARRHPAGDQDTATPSESGRSDARGIIGDAVDRAGRLADEAASKGRSGRETRRLVDRELAEATAALDVMAASRVGDAEGESLDLEVAVAENGPDPTGTPVHDRARETLEGLDPLHFPTAFPEVFAGERSGFDVVVGNPPWEEAMVQEEAFWMRYEPGLQGKSATAQRETVERLRGDRPDLVERFETERARQRARRAVLNGGPYPGMGTGNPDLYKGFCWRFWSLVDDGGHVGVVLPRSAFVAAGSEDFRRELLANGTVHDLTFLKNHGGWVFDDAEGRYTIALAAFQRSPPGEDATVPLRGPYADPAAFEAGVSSAPHRFPVDDALSWTGTASFPLLPADPRAARVFRRMARHPALDRDEPGEWRAVPHRELDAATDRERDDGTAVMQFAKDSPGESFWPVYKGASFDIWEPDTGVRYAWADPEVVVPYLQEKRRSSYRYAGSRSAFSEFSDGWIADPDTLGCHSPRLAVRGVTNRTNRRTVIPALVPPERVLTARTTHFLWPRGDAAAEAYLLGVLASIPLDWYARRFVETNLNYFLLNAFPVPRTATGASECLRRRVVELAGRLAAVDDRYADWAGAVGVACGPLADDEKRDRIHELDAVVAHLYGLDREDLRVVFETFHDNWDHESRLAGVLEHYDEWAGADKG